MSNEKNGVGNRAVTGALTPADYEGIAAAVVAQLEPWLTPPPSRLVDAATLARELGTSVPYVYENQKRLGVRRLGDGPKPRLRFDLAEARAAFLKHAEDDPAPPRMMSRRKRRTSKASGVPLLPVGETKRN